MTPKELDALISDLESLLEHATDGPWAYLSCGDKDNSWQVGVWQRPDGTPVLGEVAEDDAEQYEASGYAYGWHEDGPALCIETICENADAMANLNDAAFIAQVRTSVPQLLAEVKSARAELGRALSAALALVVEWRRRRDSGCEAYEGGSHASGLSQAAFELETALGAARGVLGDPE